MVSEKLVIEYLNHLQDLKFRKDKRAKERPKKQKVQKFVSHITQKTKHIKKVLGKSKDTESTKSEEQKSTQPEEITCDDSTEDDTESSNDDVSENEDDDIVLREIDSDDEGHFGITFIPDASSLLIKDANALEFTKESIQKVGLVAEDLMDKDECDDLKLATEAEGGANYQLTFIDKKNISKVVVGIKFYDTR